MSEATGRSREEPRAAAKKSYPMSEVTGGSREEIPFIF